MVWMASFILFRLVLKPSLPSIQAPDLKNIILRVERDSEILVRVEIPGVDKKDLDISVTENSVRIKGSVQHEEVEEKGEYYRRETSSGSFARTVVLPSEVYTSNVKTKFESGVLEMTLPKSKPSKRQKISVE